MQTNLILIRHGESTWNREGRVQGWLDPPLSARGVQQAAQLAARLRDEPIDALYSSPQQRARPHRPSRMPRDWHCKQISGCASTGWARSRA